MFMFLPLLLGAVSAGTSVAGVATTGLMAAAGTGTVGVVTRALTKAVIVRGIKEVINDNNKK